MRRTVIGLLLVVVLVAAGALLIVPWAAPRLIAWQIRSIGFDEGAVEAARFGVDEVALDQVRLADGLTARRLTLSYAPFDLVRGRLGQLVVEGLEVEALLDPERGLEVPGLEVAGGGAGGPALPLLPDGVRLVDASLSVVLPDGGRLEVEADGSLDVIRAGADRFTIEARQITGALGRGTISGSLTLRGEIEPLADDPLATLDARGSGSFEAAQIDLGALEVRSLTGVLEIAVDHSLLTIALERATARVETPEQPALVEALGGRGPLTIGLSSDAALTLDLQSRTGRLTAPLHVAAGGPSADLDLDLRYDLADGARPVEVRDLRLEVEARDLLVGPTIEHLRLDLAGDGTLAEAALHGQLALTGAGGAAGLAVDDLELALPLAVEVRPEGVRIALDQPGWLVARALQVPVAEARGRLRIVLPPAPVLQLERTPEWPWRLDLPLRLDELEATAAGTRLRGEAGELRVSAAGRGSEPGALDVQLADGTLTLPDAAIALQGLRLDLTLDPAGGASPGPVAFAVEDLRSLASPMLFAPVSVDGTVRLEQDRVRFRSTLARSGLELEIKGHRRLDRPAGRASIELQPVQFAPGGLQPRDLVPLAAGLVEQVAGEVSLSGVIALDGPSLASDLGLVLRDLGLVLGPLRIDALNGVVEVDQLNPPSTLPGQLLTIGLVDFGLAFADGRMRFELLPGGPLDVSRLNFAWAGGQITARPFTVGSADGVISVTLEARGLDLGRIFAEVRLPGLEGQGTIDGVLPVRLAGGEASIEGGRLTARRAGRLRYRPEDPPDALAAGGESMSLLLQALEDFRYDELEITLDGRTDRAMDIGLHLEGANPDLYGGHPIEFNLNLEGELANILRQGVRSYTLPDRVREQIERSRRR